MGIKSGRGYFRRRVLGCEGLREFKAFRFLFLYFYVRIPSIESRREYEKVAGCKGFRLGSYKGVFE